MGVFREIFDILFSAEGNFIQELVLKEVARMVDVAGRHALIQAGNSTFGIGNSGVLELLADEFRQLVAENPELKQTIDAALAPLTAAAVDDQSVLDSIHVLRDAFEQEIVTWVDDVTSSDPPLNE